MSQIQEICKESFEHLNATNFFVEFPEYRSVEKKFVSIRRTNLYWESVNQGWSGKQNRLYWLFTKSDLSGNFYKIKQLSLLIMLPQTRDCSFLPNSLKRTTMGTSVNAIRTVLTTEASPKFPWSTWANTSTGKVLVCPEYRITVELNSRAIVANCFATDPWFSDPIWLFVLEIQLFISISPTPSNILINFCILSESTQ